MGVYIFGIYKTWKNYFGILLHQSKSQVKYSVLTEIIRSSNWKYMVFSRKIIGFWAPYIFRL